MNPRPLIEEARLVGTFLELVQINGPTGQERPVADYLSEIFTDLGYEVEEDQVHLSLGGNCGNLLCRVPGLIEPPILLAAHLDTIAPTEGIEVLEKDGVFRSQGEGILGADDRAGIAIIIEVLRALNKVGPSPISLELLFPVSEEVGLLGSRGLKPGWLCAPYGFTLDLSGPIGSLVSRAPYGQDLTFEVRGKPAHAGLNPEDGVNAIAVAAGAINRIRQGRIDDITTANIGSINGGGATNIVPDLVSVRGEVRSLELARMMKQVRHMEEEFLGAAAEMGGDVIVQSKRSYSGFELNPDCIPLELAHVAADNLGLPFEVQTSCGASDANILNSMGIEVANLSVGMGDPHSSTEYIHRQDLFNAAKFVLEIILNAGVLGRES